MSNKLIDENDFLVSIDEYIRKSKKDNIEPLKNRVSDIPLLVEYFSEKISSNYNLKKIIIDTNNNYLLKIKIALFSQFFTLNDLVSLSM